MDPTEWTSGGGFLGRYEARDGDFVLVWRDSHAAFRPTARMKGIEVVDDALVETVEL